MQNHAYPDLRKLLNSLPVVVSYVNTDLRYMYTNDANRAFFPHVKKIEGLTIPELFGPERFELLKPNIEKVLRGESVNFEVTVPTEEGPRDMEGTYIPDFDPHGKVQGFFVHTHEVTQKKKIQLELQKSHEHYRLMFERNPMPMCIWDIETMKYLEVNHSMVETYGFTKEEFLRMTLIDIRPPEEVDDFMERVSVLAPGYRKESILFLHWKKDGTRIRVLVSSHDIEFMGRKARITMINDVTQRLKVEEDRETLLTALHEALKARDEFLTMASHELKTPITSLILNTDLKKLMLTRNELVSPAKEIDGLDVQRRQLERINHIIDDMMDLSRIRLGKLEMKKSPIDFAKVVEDSMTKLSPLLIQYLGEVNYESVSDATVIADPFRLEQVVTNLLSNAAKYGENRPITVTLQKSETQAIFSVQDQGRGISIEDQKRIFSRFERVISGSDIAGLGLGLTIVKEIIDSHQGHITVESSLGKGSRFTVELPLHLS
jgi:PAS domain S-box-containing protein